MIRRWYYFAALFNSVSAAEIMGITYHVQNISFSVFGRLTRGEERGSSLTCPILRRHFEPPVVRSIYKRREEKMKHTHTFGRWEHSFVRGAFHSVIIKSSDD